VDELLIYQAPILLGDKARGMFDLGQLNDLTAARRLDIVECRVISAVPRSRDGFKDTASHNLFIRTRFL